MTASARSFERLRDEDIDRLVALAREWQIELERRKPHWRAYSDRLLCICLAQGAALHVIDGRSGVKDFDLYRFFAACSERPCPDPAIYRGKTHVDFGVSRFGLRTDTEGRQRFPRFVGRNVDIFSAALPVAAGSEPVRAIQAWLDDPQTTTQRALAAKAVIVIEPRPLRVAWPRAKATAVLRGYERHDALPQLRDRQRRG